MNAWPIRYFLLVRMALLLSLEGYQDASFQCALVGVRELLSCCFCTLCTLQPLCWPAPNPRAAPEAHVQASETSVWLCFGQQIPVPSYRVCAWRESTRWCRRGTTRGWRSRWPVTARAVAMCGRHAAVLLNGVPRVGAQHELAAPRSICGLNPLHMCSVHQNGA